MLPNEPPRAVVLDILDELNALILGRPTFGELRARDWQEVLDSRTINESNPLSPNSAENDNSLRTDFFL